ncbi:MAG: hypothetical protein QF685_13175 [Verrucomicrobiota bacterium]|nr:hypothetical protein [Verrucomicrobiota bacterium]
MLDRESTFASPTIVKLLQTRFIPVAIDQAYQRRQKDNEGRFYQKIANQGPRKIGRGTTQGLYTADASGRLLAFTNNRGAHRVQRMLQTALQKHRPAKVAAITKGAPDARYNPQPPKGGLVVRVTSKILNGYEEPENEFRRIFQTSLGRDNLWIRADEHAALAKGQLPESLLKRLARYHLVDNTRGEPPMWRENEIQKLEGKIENGHLRASAQLKNTKGDRGYEAELLGYVETKAGKVTRLDIVAKGQFWGEGTYTRNAPKGRFPLAIAFTLADGKDTADTIPPQGSRGWVQGYIQ